MSIKLSPEDEQRYQELFAEGESPQDTTPFSKSKLPLNFQRMGSELAAIRKAERAFNKQRDLLRKDGWSESEIEDLLAEYGESWATGLIKQRAQRTSSQTKLDLYIEEPRMYPYAAGHDEVGFWLYDLREQDPDSPSEPKRLFQLTCPMSPIEIARRINAAKAETLAEQLEIKGQVEDELRAQYGEMLYAGAAVGRKRGRK